MSQLGEIRATVTGSDLLLAHGEYAFGDVLDAFATADRVMIASYNLTPKRDSDLLEAIRAVGSRIPVVIVTNIPRRFSNYTSERARASARTQIGQYLRLLDPSALGAKVEVYFCFANHAKLVSAGAMTYLGSANYSDASKYNYEVGVICCGDEAASFAAVAFEELKSVSIPHCGIVESTTVPRLISAFDELLSLADAIDEANFSYETGPGSTAEVRLFPFDARGISESVGQRFRAVFEDLLDLEEDTGVSAALRRLLSSRLLLDELDSIEELLADDAPLIRFARREELEQEYMDVHALEAYDDKLEEYSIRASQHADSVLEQVSAQAESDANRLLEFITGSADALDTLLRDLREADLVDNT